MSKSCEICGRQADDLTVLIFDGVPKACSECAQKYVKLKKGEIKADEIITDYTPEEIANALRDKEVRVTENIIMQEEKKPESDCASEPEPEEESALEVLFKVLLAIVIVIGIFGLCILIGKLIIGMLFVGFLKLLFHWD